MSRRLGPIAAALAVTLVTAAGCDGGGGSSEDTTSWTPEAQVAKLRALPFTVERVGAAAYALQASSAQLAGDGTENVAAPVQLADWQVTNLAAEAANGGGIRGDDLAAMTGTPAGAPPIEYLVAAWITTYQSYGALFAKELMGQQDWHQADRIRFPRLVIALFLADATAGAPRIMPGAPPSATPAGPTPSAHAMGDRMPRYRLVADNPCGVAASFIQNAILAVANALKVNTSGGGLFGFLGKIWNAAIDLAAGLIKGLIDTVTRPIVNLLVQVFGVVATILQVSSFLTQWRATTELLPDRNRYGVDTEEVTGQVRVTVNHDQLPIPDFVVGCAKAFDVDLENAGSTAGSGVTWDARNEGPADLSAEKAFDGKLDAARSARYTYRTGQEPREVAEKGEEHSGLLRVGIAVQRNDIQKVRELFAALVLDQLPELVRGVVGPYAKSLLDGATRHLTAISDVSTVAYVPITYHSRTEPTPSPASPTPSRSVKAKLPTNCPPDLFGYHEPSRDDRGGSWVCWYIRKPGEYQLGIGVLDMRLTKPQVPGAQAVAIPGADAAWIDDGCTTSVGPCFNIDVVVGDKTLQVTGGTSREQTIAIAKKVLSVA